MKRETLRHPKTYDLAARLHCTRPEALGYLILLWDFTAEASTEGSIGRWPDGAIARACDWQGEPADFINSLVDASWVDRDQTHRLLIHGWQEHCERWVKAKLEKLGKKFAQSTQNPIMISTEPSTEATTEPSPPRDRTEPNQTEPNRTTPAVAVARAPRVEPLRTCSPEYEAFWLAVAPHKRKGKLDGWKAYQEAAKLLAGRNGDAHVFLLDRATAYYASPLGQTPFCHGPGPFLRQGNYDDDPAAWQRKEPTPSSPARVRSAQPIADRYPNPTDQELTPEERASIPF